MRLLTTKPKSGDKRTREISVKGKQVIHVRVDGRLQRWLVENETVEVDEIFWDLLGDDYWETVAIRSCPDC